MDKITLVLKNTFDTCRSVSGEHSSTDAIQGQCLGSIDSIKATLVKSCFELRFDTKSFNAMHQSLHFTRGRSIHLERLSSVVFHIPIFCLVPSINQTEQLSPGGRVTYITAALFQAFSGRSLRCKAELNGPSFIWYILTVY